MKIALQAVFLCMFRQQGQPAPKTITITKSRNGSSRTVVNDKKGGQNRPNKNPRKGRKNGNNQVIISKNIPGNMSNVYKAKQPEMKSKGTDITIRHTEFVGSVPVSGDVGAMSMRKLACNPANSQMFPWLSLIARGYEKYRIHKMNFRYVAQASTFTSGSAFLYIDYDPLDPTPTDLHTMAQSSDAFSMSTIFQNNQLKVKNRPEQPKSFLIEDESELTSNGQILLSVPFNLYFGCLDSEIEQTPGFIYIDYEVTLMVPTAENIPRTINRAVTGAVTLNAGNAYCFDPNQLIKGPIPGGNQNFEIDVGNSEYYLTVEQGGWRAKMTLYLTFTMEINAHGFDVGRPLSAGVTKAKSTSGGTIGTYYRQIKDISEGTDTWVLTIMVYLEQGDLFYVSGNLTNSSDENATVFYSWASNDPKYWNSKRLF